MLLAAGGDGIIISTGFGVSAGLGGSALEASLFMSAFNASADSLGAAVGRREELRVGGCDGRLEPGALFALLCALLDIKSIVAAKPATAALSLVDASFPSVWNDFTRLCNCSAGFEISVSVASPSRSPSCSEGFSSRPSSICEASISNKSPPSPNFAASDSNATPPRKFSRRVLSSLSFN